MAFSCVVRYNVTFFALIFTFISYTFIKLFNLNLI